MSEIAVRTDHLSKQYRIGRAEPYRSLRESLSSAVTGPLRALAARRSGAPGAPAPTFWALRDVSFEIRQGEVMGIVGHNGAGKSTLLKILSRIAEPSAGTADVYGRVGSLLEVGTGFHPELTGRENIYLSGAIMGMKRAEIERKFDAIVDFSEVEKFLDTPVKRYSSGMYVRLAFAVAAHLEPEILLVDEVLAVGDLAFQQKCLKHIRTLTQRGMTIVMVSHNMAAIQSSCSRAIHLEAGAITLIGKPVEVIEHHRHRLQAATVARRAGAPTGDDPSAAPAPVAITGFAMLGADGSERRDFRFDEPIRVRIDLYAAQRIERPLINFGIKRGDGVIVCNFNNWYDNCTIPYIEGACSLEGWLPPLRLVPDYYEAHVLVWPWGAGHLGSDVGQFTPYAADTFGEFVISGPALNAEDGVFQTPAQQWRFQQGETTINYTTIGPDSIFQVFGEEITTP